jgi:hypothetical protein
MPPALKIPGTVHSAVFFGRFASVLRAGAFASRLHLAPAEILPERLRQPPFPFVVRFGHGRELARITHLPQAALTGHRRYGHSAASRRQHFGEQAMLP